jgi:hypothetical protein
MSKTTKAGGWWCVVYCGAPYGDNEFGEVVSKHRTEEAAEEALRKARRISPARYHGGNGRVKFKEAAPLGRPVKPLPFAGQA